MMQQPTINLSEEEDHIKIKGFKKLVILPDYSPNRGLPVGTVAVFDKQGHKINPSYIGSDVGCGMIMSKFGHPIKNLEDSTNKLASRLIDNPIGLGSLGGGNHFITIYHVDRSGIPKLQEGDYAVLIHSGSRGIGVKSLGKDISDVDYAIWQEGVLVGARRNRKRLLEIVEDCYENRTAPIIEKVHNLVQQNGSEIIYRKGAVEVQPGHITVIPSSMGGGAAVVRANKNILRIEHSLPHATGRKISRSDAKKQEFFLDGFPNGLYVPYFLYPEHLNEELPQNYKGLDGLLQKIKDYVTVEARLSPRASVML